MARHKHDAGDERDGDDGGRARGGGAEDDDVDEDKRAVLSAVEVDEGKRAVKFAAVDGDGAELAAGDGDDDDDGGGHEPDSDPGDSDSDSDSDADSSSPETTRGEMTAYYLYYVGANGLGLFNFAPAALQNLVDAAASTTGDGQLAFAGRRRDANSIVLLANGVSFALQAVLMVAIGAYADFGTGRRWVLLAWSGVGFGVGFAWLAAHEAERWRVAVGLYVVGLVAYQLTLTYWTAAFPALARNSRAVRAARRGEVEERRRRRRRRRTRGGGGGGGGGEVELEDHSSSSSGSNRVTTTTTTTTTTSRRVDELERSRLSNVAFWLQSLGEVAMLAIAIGAMHAARADASPSRNARALSALIAASTACWAALALPWFVLERTRRGRALPPGHSSVLTAGLAQLGSAATTLWRLRQSLVYMVGYFALGDALNTTVTVVATLQNRLVAYSTLTLTYLLLVGIAAQAVGIGLCWLLQRRLRLAAKTLFTAVVVAIVALDAWGVVGNWTDAFGFRNRWELWLYQALYGLCVCPWYSYSQILISSVTPRGYEFLFFSLFNVAGKASSFVGPFISSAIIDAAPGPRAHNAPFYFLFALSLASALFLCTFLDLDRSAREQEAFLADERHRRRCARRAAAAVAEGRGPWPSSSSSPNPRPSPSSSPNPSPPSS